MHSTMATPSHSFGFFHHRQYEGHSQYAPPSATSSSDMLGPPTKGAIPIDRPNSNDVLCGRGVTTNRYPGNEKFRSLVGVNKELYVTSTKRQKMEISRSIVQAVKSMDPSGRFLERNPDTGFWYEIEERKAIEKTSQALRDGAASLRRQLSEDLGDPDFLSAVFDMDATAPVPNMKLKEKEKERAEKIKPVKAKILPVKKGHRRSRSNPDNFAAHKMVRRLKSLEVPESPQARPRNSLPTSIRSVPASPMTGQVNHRHPYGEFVASPSQAVFSPRPDLDSCRSSMPQENFSPGQEIEACRSSPVVPGRCNSFSHDIQRFPTWHHSPRRHSAVPPPLSTATSFPPPPLPRSLRSPMSAGRSQFLTSCNGGGQRVPSQGVGSPPVTTSPGWSPASFAFNTSPSCRNNNGSWRASPTAFPGNVNGDLTVPRLHREPSASSSYSYRSGCPRTPSRDGSYAPFSPSNCSPHTPRFSHTTPRKNLPYTPYLDFAPPPSPLQRRNRSLTGSRYKEIQPRVYVSSHDASSTDNNTKTDPTNSNSWGMHRSHSSVSYSATSEESRGGSPESEQFETTSNHTRTRENSFDEKKEEEEHEMDSKASFKHHIHNPHSHHSHHHHHHDTMQDKVHERNDVFSDPMSMNPTFRGVDAGNMVSSDDLDEISYSPLNYEDEDTGALMQLSDDLMQMPIVRMVMGSDDGSSHEHVFAMNNNGGDCV